MSLSISNESKNDLAITNDEKGIGRTWNESTETWDEANKSTWDIQRLVITKDSKNALTITNESKN